MLTCSCCGNGLMEADDVSEPGSDDVGFGMCKPCGGDPEARSFKKRIGTGMVTFCEARFPVVRDALSRKNQVKWDSLSYRVKCDTVGAFVQSGAIPW